MVEVLIAGGGPAGAAAAMVLARAGVRVLVVERERFPRVKLCGDTLNPGALRLLESLGVRAEIQARGRPLEGMRVTAPDGWTVTATYPGWQGLAITRDVLDAELLTAAGRAGAQIQEQVQVVDPLLDEHAVPPVVRGAVLRTRQGLIRVPATVTVAAEGRRSTLGRALGLTSHPASPRRWAVGAYYTGVQGCGPYGEMHIRRGHYIGVAPITPELTNACVVTSDREWLRRPLEVLDQVLVADPVLRDRLGRAERVSATMCLGPLAVQARGCGMHGLVMAGDAAGFIDPMTGDGLRFAIEGGMLAARAILDALEAPVLPPYQRLARLRRRAFARKQRLNRVLRAIVGSEMGVAVGEVGAHLVPGLLRTMIRLAGDVPSDPDPLAPAVRSAGRPRSEDRGLRGPVPR